MPEHALTDLVDTIVGGAVALIATYLLSPRDRETKGAPVPAATPDLRGEE